MDPLIGAGLIAGGASLLGNLFGWSSNKKATQSAYDAQIAANQSNEMLQYQNQEWQERMLDKTNAYNTPSAVKQRYLDAGINPYLAMVNGGTGGASGNIGSVPTAHVDSGANAIAQLGAQQSQMFSDMGKNLGSSLQNVAQGISVASKTESEINKALAETYSLYKKTDNDTARTLLQNRLQFLMGNKTVAEIHFMKTQENLIVQQISESASRIALNASQIELNKITSKHLDEKMSAEISEIVSRTVVNGVQARLSQQEIVESVSRTALNYAFQESTQKDIEYKTQENKEQKRDSSARAVIAYQTANAARAAAKQALVDSDYAEAEHIFGFVDSSWKNLNGTINAIGDLKSVKIKAEGLYSYKQGRETYTVHRDKKGNVTGATHSRSRQRQ